MDGDGTTTPVAGRASAVGVYDPSNARDALRFVSEMLQAGTAEEVVQQVLLTDQREQWSAVLRSLVDGDEEMGWTRSEGSEEVVRLQEQLSAATATIASIEEASAAQLVKGGPAGSQLYPKSVPSSSIRERRLEPARLHYSRPETVG